MSLSTNAASVLPLVGRDTGAADAGNVYTALTPTPGTGIIGHAAPTTFDQTKAIFLLYNSGASNVYPLYLKLHNTVISAGANGVMYFTQVVDTGNRFSSGGTALTPQNTNYGSSSKSAALITVGAVVCSANTNASRTLAHHTFRGATIDVVHDRYTFTWGLPSSDGSYLAGATYASLTQGNVPVVIPPGASFMIHEWEASQSTGPTYEFEFGYIER